MARTALERVGLRPERITVIEGGWANWTFDLDGEWIARFPRNDAVGMATHRELNLLPELAPTVSFPIPVPSHVGTLGDRPFFVYRRLAGTPIGQREPAPTFAAGLGSMLAELHAFPVEVAAQLLRAGAPALSWRTRYTDLWEVVQSVALPEMDRELADDVTRAYAAMVEQPPEFVATLIHNDLGPEHVLVDDDGAPVGMIDFEDATIGDPAVDLTWWMANLGEAPRADVLAGRDLGERLSERLWFYRWMGSVDAVIYGVTEGVDEERVGGVREARRRFDLPH